jgi:hypothetical protein
MENIIISAQKDFIVDFIFTQCIIQCKVLSENLVQSKIL